MASTSDGLGSPAIEQDPGIAQIQAAQLGAQAALQVALPATGFVASINALSGLITIAAGTNIAVTSDGVSTITISATGISQAAQAQSNVAAGAPSPSNDESEGFSQFSQWIDTSIPDLYECLDASTGAAVWVKLN